MGGGGSASSLFPVSSLFGRLRPEPPKGRGVKKGPEPDEGAESDAERHARRPRGGPGPSEGGGDALWEEGGG